MFQFYKPPFKGKDDEKGHVATLAAHIHTTRDLISKVGKALGFPKHFGKNFDAFWDCVRDLPKDPARIVLVHQDLPKIDDEDLETYLELLRDSVLYWEKHSDEHSFAVWFPEDCEKKIAGVLADIPLPEDEELE